MKKLLMVWLNILLVLSVTGYQSISATEAVSSETIQYLNKDNLTIYNRVVDRHLLISFEI